MADQPLNDSPLNDPLLSDPLLSALREARPPAPAEPAAAAAEALFARITAGQGTPAPSGTAPRRVTGWSRQRNPRRAGRRPFLVAAGGVAAAAFAVAGLLAANVLSGGSPGRVTAGHDGEKFETTAYVISRINTSVAALATDVIHVHRVDQKYILDDWYGPHNNLVRLQTYSRTGRLLFDITETTKTITVADYGNHEWWSLPNTPSAVPTVLTCGTDCFIIKPGPRGRNGFPLSAGLVSSSISGTRYQISEKQPFRGQQATDLVAHGPGGEVSQLLVNTASYLPLQLTTREGSPGSSSVSSTYYLPPTPANLARFRLAIPAGFRQHGENR